MEEEIKQEILNKVKETWSNESQIGFSDMAMKEAIELTWRKANEKSV